MSDSRPSVAVLRAAEAAVEIASARLGITVKGLRFHDPAGKRWAGRVRASRPREIELVTGRSPRATAKTTLHEARHCADLQAGRVPALGPTPESAERRARRFAERALKEWDRRRHPDGRKRWIPLPRGRERNPPENGPERR